MASKRLFSLLVTLALIGLPLLASGHGYRLGDIRIVHPWAMPTAPSIAAGASGVGYLVLKNGGHRSDKLLSASTEIAEKVELHAYGKASDTPTMRRVDTVEIPAGGEVRLEPGGSHLMLIGVKKPLEEGQHFPIVLEFEHAGKITVDMVVQTNTNEATY
jgi:copper(I)-binding protein